MKFVVSLHSLSCSSLLCPSDRASYRPYLRFNFDGFRKSSTRPLHFPSEHSRNDVAYPDTFSFTYETAFPLKLHQKALSVKVYSKNAILSDDLLGSASVDLHTLATGPSKQSLALSTAKGQPAGRAHFVCDIEQLCSVTLHLRSVALSTLPVLNKKTPISHLTYSLTTLDSKKRYKTEKQSNTVSPVFPTFHPLKLSGTLQSFWREGVELHVMLKANSRDTSHKMGTVTLRVSEHHAFKDQQPLSVVERVVVTPEYTGVQCVMRVHCDYEGMPSFVQMVGGLHDERGVHDAVPFAEGLPLPKASFFETRLPQPPPPAAAGGPPQVPSPAPLSVRAAEGRSVRRRDEREGSVMSQKAAREYDGASVVRWKDRYYDEEDDSDSPTPARRPRSRPSSSLGVDSAAASAAPSRGMSRSSSSGNLASPARRPTTPSSQKRYLAYPPPPPPKPDVSSAMRVSLRALSISSPRTRLANEERRGSVGEERERSDRSPSAGEVFNYAPAEETAAPAMQPGQLGLCAVCSRSASLMCAQMQLPVCSYSCKMKCLQAHGLAVDDEKERPPPLNPEAALLSPSSRSVQAASPHTRQPGPAGFCVVCQYPALFVCKDTLVAVCSAECKTVNLRLNPHLQGAGGRMVEPSAPSRTLLFGSAAPPPLPWLPLPPPSPPPPSSTEPARCVVCGDESEFRCSVTDVPVCSKECKAVHLKVRQRTVTAQQQQQPQQLRPCPTCTFNNSSAAAACEICSTPLLPAASSSTAVEPPSPLAPSFHLQQLPPKPAVPKRPSVGPLISSPVAAAPGGPTRMR